MGDKKYIYYLDEEDVQTVAMEVLERNLSDKEIEKIKDSIANKIQWFEAIEYSIYEHIESPTE